MVEPYFENVGTGKRYQLIRMNPDGTVTLKGPQGLEFSVEYSKDRFIKMGYVLRTEK